MAGSSCSLDSDSWSLISSSDFYTENNNNNQNDSKQRTTTLSSPAQAAPPPSHSDGGALNDDYSDDVEIEHHPRKETERYHRLDRSDYYKQLLEKNKHYIQEPPTVEQCNLLAKQLRYTRLASVPARYEALWNEFNQVKQFLKKRKELKVQDAGIATLFGLECFLLFKAGEIIGRGGTITGYHL